jgi:hypothetical protein
MGAPAHWLRVPPRTRPPPHSAPMVHGPEHTTKTEEELYQKAGSSHLRPPRHQSGGPPLPARAPRQKQPVLQSLPNGRRVQPSLARAGASTYGCVCPAPTRLALRSLSVPLSACWDLLSVVLHPLSSNEPSPMPGEAPYYRITPNTITSLCPYRTVFRLNRTLASVRTPRLSALWAPRCCCFTSHRFLMQTCLHVCLSCQGHMRLVVP